MYGSIVNCTANSDSRVTVPGYAIIYLFELSYLTTKVTLALKRKLILSYFSCNTWTAAIQENREFYIKISNQLKIFHPGWLVADAETMKYMKVRNAMLVLRVVLLSTYAKFILKDTVLQLWLQRKSLTTQSAKIYKKHSEWFDFFFSLKCFEADNSEWRSLSPPFFIRWFFFPPCTFGIDSTVMTSVLIFNFIRNEQAWLEYQNLKIIYETMVNCPSTYLLNTQKTSNVIYGHINNTE